MIDHMFALVIPDNHVAVVLTVILSGFTGWLTWMSRTLSMQRVRQERIEERLLALQEHLVLLREEVRQLRNWRVAQPISKRGDLPA